ncbi:MAG: EpsI family protein [Burkholderiales bacterium]|nr:EpsI family protein [Burkholderiales bacterium]
MRIKSLGLLFAMLLAAGLSVALQPKPLYSAGQKPDVNLSQLIPEAFGGWRADTDTPSTIVSPDMQAQLTLLYSDMLSRTYVNSKGDRVMLSLAYGADQGRALQVHKPEVCYEAQGFKLADIQKAAAQIDARAVPVMRLQATIGARHEPITYWIRSGDYLVRGWWEQNVARVKSGLQGFLPDGMLVRVSTIDDDRQHAYVVQDQFLNDLTNALSPKAKEMLLGKKLPEQQ